MALPVPGQTPAQDHWDQVEWGRLTLGSFQLPGSWDVGGSCSRRIAVKTKKGADNAVTKDEGYQPGELTLRGRFISQADWTALQPALKEIHPRKKGANRDPLVIVHPSTAALGINTVYVTEISAPQIDEQGICEIEIKVLEWTPQTKALPGKKPAPISKNNNDILRGRELLMDNGQIKVDLGVPPPRDSSLEYLDEPATFVGGGSSGGTTTEAPPQFVQ